MLRFDRIRHLLSPDSLHNKRVVQVGIGSGGAPVNEHLTMNGVRRWALFDPDRYEELNLVKHPRMRADLGRLKVDVQKDWILDRNPSAEVDVFADNVLHSQRFRGVAANADLVLCCTDTQASRLFVNTVAVEVGRPCVTASVYRQGFGGEAYAYIPTVSGCFNCMLKVAEQNGWNMEGRVDLLPSESEAIYGLDQKDFRASGLSMDIQAISILQARLAMDALLNGTERRLALVPANWVIFYNRGIPQNHASGFLKNLALKVKPQRNCTCSQQ